MRSVFYIPLRVLLVIDRGTYLFSLCNDDTKYAACVSIMECYFLTCACSMYLGAVLIVRLLVVGVSMSITVNTNLLCRIVTHASDSKLKR